jgi:methyl-accepting chemotaxis protein
MNAVWPPPGSRNTRQRPLLAACLILLVAMATGTLVSLAYGQTFGASVVFSGVAGLGGALGYAIACLMRLHPSQRLSPTPPLVVDLAASGNGSALVIEPSDGDDRKARLVVDELGQYNKLFGVMRGQLGSVTAETETAAQAILVDLYAVDKRIQEMMAFLDHSGGAEKAVDVLDRAEARTAVNLRLLSTFREQRVRDADDNESRLKDVKSKVDLLNQTVDLIRTDARLAKMLAFNATIEAARAGEAGVGFAVVAAEVRQFSQSSDRAALDIQNGIAELDVVITQSIQTMFGERVESERAGFELITLSTQQVKEDMNRLIASQRSMLDKVHQESQLIAKPIMDLIAAIQFQDVTRQQLEQVSGAMVSLAEHTGHLKACVEGNEQDGSFENLQTKIEEMFNQYVRAQQRNVHQAAIGGMEQESTASLVELF